MCVGACETFAVCVELLLCVCRRVWKFCCVCIEFLLCLCRSFTLCVCVSILSGLILIPRTQASNSPGNLVPNRPTIYELLHNLCFCLMQAFERLVATPIFPINCLYLERLVIYGLIMTLHNSISVIILMI